MKKTIFIIIGFLTIALIALYLIFIDNLPPRTPQKVARIVSGLSIPRDARVLEFKDEWNNFNGNGFSFITLSLEEEAFSKIYQEAKSLQFTELPINETIYGPLKTFSEKKVNGIYKITIDNSSSMSFSGTIICEDSKTVAVYIAVN